MSQEGYDKLIAELHRLEAIERPKASAAIAEAREKGDLSENSEYDAAKEAQAHLEDKINKLKTTISEAKVVDTSRLSTDSVQILTKVEMTNLTTKAKMSYTIVSENEADLRAGKISIKTPIAQGFFEDGDEASLRPMILKDIAEKTGLDLSTISRVSNSKYALTRWGTFPYA